MACASFQEKKRMVIPRWYTVLSLTSGNTRLTWPDNPILDNRDESDRSPSFPVFGQIGLGESEIRFLHRIEP
jgi:hypothetical protein